MPKLKISEECYSLLQSIYNELHIKAKRIRSEDFLNEHSRLILGGVDSNNTIRHIKDVKTNFGCLLYPGITMNEEGNIIFNIYKKDYLPNVVIKVSPVLKIVKEVYPDKYEEYRRHFYHFPERYYRAETQAVTFDGAELLCHILSSKLVWPPPPDGSFKPSSNYQKERYKVKIIK